MCVCVCVCERERVCVCERERESLCVSESARERAREKECVWSLGLHPPARGEQTVFFDYLDLYLKSPDSDERQYKSRTQKWRFDPALSAGGRNPTASPQGKTKSTISDFRFPGWQRRFCLCQSRNGSHSRPGFGPSLRAGGTTAATTPLHTPAQRMWHT